MPSLAMCVCVCVCVSCVCVCTQCIHEVRVGSHGILNTSNRIRSSRIYASISLRKTQKIFLNFFIDTLKQPWADQRQGRLTPSADPGLFFS